MSVNIGFPGRFEIVISTEDKADIIKRLRPDKYTQTITLALPGTDQACENWSSTSSYDGPCNGLSKNKYEVHLLQVAQS